MSKLFFTMNNPKPRASTPCGRAVLPKYGYLPDPDTGEEVLTVVGSEDVYEKTQLSRPDDLYTLLKKAGVEPDDMESLAKSKAYAETLIQDFCSAPRDLIEAHNVIHKAQLSFDQLPSDVKQEFGNSSSEMLRSLIDNTFDKRMSKFLTPKAEEVPSDETK